MNPKITLKQTSIVIDNYEMGMCPKLESYFTLFDKNTFSYYTYGIEYNEELKQLIIPRGLDVNLIEKLLESKSYISNNYDNYDHIEPFMLKLRPRDDNQVKTLKFLLGNEEFSETKFSSQLAINLNTGAGKTYCAIAYLGIISHRGIVITSSASIITQWKKRCKQYTNISDKEILVLNGSNVCFKILNGSLDISKYKLILSTHSTIRNLGMAYGWDKVTNLFIKMKIGTKIYDECHKDFQNLYKIDYYTNTYKTIYISATLNRSSKDEDFVYQLYFKNIPIINLFNPETDNRTKYISIKFDSEPSPKDRGDVYDYKYGINRLRYVKYLINNPNFYKASMFIINLIYNKLNDNEKALIYISTNEAIEIFYNWFIDVYNYNQDDIGIFTSILSHDAKQKQLDKKIILTTTKSAGEAIDIENLKITVVLAEPFKSRVIAKQSLGRTRDRDTLYIELVDIAFKKIIEYYEFKKEIFEKHATECLNTHLTKSNIDNIKEPRYLFKIIPKNKIIDSNKNTN